jgi:DNA mismatch endonuclease (patch repair protein)
MDPTRPWSLLGDITHVGTSEASGKFVGWPMDFLTTEQRSVRMKRVRSTNTKPEMTVRRIVWALGWRYRLNVRSLPGKPDLAIRKAKKAIFVHGCFWHAHEGCRRATVPATRVDFWTSKLAYNRRRDQDNTRALENTGWKVLVIWECELRDSRAVVDRLISFLGA